MKDLLIVVPVYNEEKRIRANTELLLDFFEKTGIEFTIVLSVDKSPDDSEEICKLLENTYERVSTIIHLKKGGRGLAVRDAWEKFEAKVYSFIDADLSGGLDALFTGYQLIHGGEEKFVIGSRYSAGSKTERPPLRKVVSIAYNLLLRNVFKNSIKDFQCGLKLMSSELKEEIIDLSRVNSWFWDAEIIIICLQLGISVRELPVEWKENKYVRTSLKRLFHDIILHGWGLLLLYKRSRIKGTLTNSSTDSLKF